MASGCSRFVLCTLLFGVVGAPSAQTPRDGDVLASSPRPLIRKYESLDNFGRSYFPRAVYEEARQQEEFDILDVRYASGGIDVPGVIIRPKNLAGRRLPAIVFNRPGTGDFGRIDDLTIVDLYLFAKAGFVVVASDYRFHGTSAKRDEWGGRDLDDVLNIIRLAQSLEAVDPARLFMLGLSRGGFMTYLALKHGAPVLAAAVIAGPTDLEALGGYRSGFVNGDETYDGWAHVWPEYEHRAAEYYRERSPVYWADKISVPVLILHSRQDKLVPVDHALRMAAALQAAGRRYGVHIYANDGHSLPLHRADRNRQIIEWFLQAP